MLAFYASYIDLLRSRLHFDWSVVDYWLEHEEATWLLNIQLERLEQTRQNSQVKVKEDSDQSEDSDSSVDEAAPLASTNAFALLGEDD